MKEKLKTLKDLGNNMAPSEIITYFKRDLKSEAVKWAKEGLSQKKNSGVINWIKHFFNITEEDLQEKK